MVIGYTTGVYDLFHIGHLNLLKDAKGLCVCWGTDSTPIKQALICLRGKRFGLMLSGGMDFLENPVDVCL